MVVICGALTPLCSVVVGRGILSGEVLLARIEYAYGSVIEKAKLVC